MPHAVVTIKGCTKVGLSLLLFTVRPMKPGATLMNDFLFNVALVLLATNAAIQFCAQAFALYANESAIYEIWGNQVGQKTCATVRCHLTYEKTLCSKFGMQVQKASADVPDSFLFNPDFRSPLQKICNQLNSPYLA